MKRAGLVYAIISIMGINACQQAKKGNEKDLPDQQAGESIPYFFSCFAYSCNNLKKFIIFGNPASDSGDKGARHGIEDPERRIADGRYIPTRLWIQWRSR